MQDTGGFRVGGVSFAGRVEFLDEVDSTQRVAREMLGSEDGVPGGVLVVARRQVGGRGRLGREWGSPEGGLWMSYGVRPEISPQYAPRLTQSAAVAVAKTLIELGLEARIKWPNDVTVGGRKLCGILAESSTSLAGGETVLDYVIIGIGLNVNVDPEELGLPPERATSLKRVLGREIPLERVLSHLLPNLEAEVLKVGDFTDTLVELRLLSETIGKRVRVEIVGGDVTGTAVNIDRDGGLVLSVDGTGKRMHLLEGDVEHLRRI